MKVAFYIECIHMCIHECYMCVCVCVALCFSHSVIQIVHDAEDHLELCKLHAEKARERLLEVHMQKHANAVFPIKQVKIM